MSGPKVFHVVTREELVARCEAHLRRLDAAIAEWTKACVRSGAADAKAAEAVVERRELGKSGRAIPADLRRDLVCLPLINHS